MRLHSLGVRLVGGSLKDSYPLRPTWSLSMTKHYINTGFVPGRSDYTNTSDAVHVGTANFVARRTSVKVGGASQPMVSMGLTVVQPFGVTTYDGSCEVGQLNESIKAQINVRYGDDTAITRMRAEINHLLDIWQAANAAYGVVPPIDTDLNN